MRRQNLLYYKNATLLKNALSFLGQSVLKMSEIVWYIRFMVIDYYRLILLLFFIVTKKFFFFPNHVETKYPRFLILSWEKEYLQTKRLLNATSHFLISHIVGHLLEFIKISLGPPILKIDNFT